MPGGVAHTGSIGVSTGPSAAEYAEQALGDSRLTGGQAGNAPAGPNVVESDRGDSYVSDISGQQGASLIMPGGNAQDSFSKRNQPVNEEPARNAQQTTAQNTQAQFRAAAPTTVAQPSRPNIEVGASLIQPQASAVAQPQQGQQQQQAPDGRVLMRPQAAAQETSRAFSAADFGATLSEDERNQNLADLNIEAPPVAEASSPIEIGTQDFKHARAKRNRVVDIQETAQMVANATHGRGMAAQANREEQENLVEPYEPTKNKNRLATKDASGSTFYEAERATKAATTAAVAHKNWTGNGFTEKVTASRNVDPEDVSIGSQIVAELIREPGNNLINIVNQATGLNFTLEQIIDQGGLNSFIDAINQSTIYVIGSKSPVPNPESSQGRRLRVHYGRGVRVHPTQTKIYNLDFDGDGVTIQFNTDGTLFRNAMDLLINSMNEPMVDLDFFPIAQIAESRKDFIRKFRNSFLTRLGDDIDTDALAGAFYDLMYPQLAPSGKDKRELTMDFIRAMNDVASNYSNRHTVLSYILKDIFETSLLAKQLQVEIMASTNADPMIDVVEEMPADRIVTMVIEDIALGNLPPNFQDFLIGLGRYIGEVPEKNVMFRLGADVAKRIKFSGTTFKGEEGARELYELTLEAGMAAFMNGRSNIGDKINYVQQIAKREIIRKVGFPSNYNNLADFLRAFAREYNRFYSMIDMAQVEFGCDLDPVYSTISDHAIHGDKITDIAQPIVTIYGDYTLERMFPNALSYAADLSVNAKEGRKIPVHRKGNTLLPRYKRTSLSKLSRDNRIAVDYDEVSKVRAVNATEMDLVLAIADKRKSKASQFNKDLDELLENFTKGLQDFAVHHRRRARNQADFLAYTNDVMSCFHISGPDMFAYYGMTNPSAFLNSYYGDLLQRAANKKKGAVDHMGGVRMTMVIQYRMRNVQNINAEIDRLIREEPDNLLYTIPRINELQNQLVNELAILGSSSDLWGVLAQEVNGNTSAWDALVESKGKLLGQWCDAKDFWKKGHKRYNSLMEVMIDPAIPKSEKEAIAADVVKQATGFLQLQRHEMNYQLEIGPHSNYTTLSTMAYRDQPNVLSDIEKANSRFRNFFENDWESMQADVKQARAQSNPGDLDSYIQHIAENPQAYMDVDDGLIVDAINAQMDKTSRASEKAHQEMPVDALYNALSLQRGGLTNAMYRSDARVLGMIPERSLSAFDVLAVLADPSLLFTVYNGTRRYILSREVLCGNNSEEVLWDMLENNPRIASILRPGVATVSNGSVYRNAKQGFQEGFMAPRTSKDVLRGKVKAQLTDRPMFLAMVAMFRPSGGRSSRSVRQETKDSLNALQTILIGLGKRVADGDPIDAANTLKVMGVTVESLQTIGGMDQTAAESWYNEMSECLNRYLSEVAGIIREGGFQSDARAIFEETPLTKLQFDASSVALAVDVRQTMTGAKTETSTNIEGGMTQDNLGLGLWAMSINDEFTVIDGDMSDEELAEYAGCMTNAGIFDGTNIEDLELSLAPDVPLVVQMPEGMVRQDKTLDDDENFQIPSVARAAITKRTKAAEDHNLKAKKAGDDGLDSITKSIRYIKDARNNVGIVEEVYDREGRFGAVMKLAEILQSADIAEGYKDMDLADYANIASLMIKEIQDDATGESTIVVRSLGEISLAIRNNMDQAVVEHGTPREKIDNAAAIADQVGLEAMIQSEYLTNAALMSVSSIRSNVGVGSFRPAKNASMSSADRSFKMLRQLTDAELLKLPWGGQTQKPAANVLSKMKLRGFQNEIRNMIPFDIGKTNYNFIGVVGGGNTITHVSPGQTSVWYLLPDATQDEIDMALRRCYAYGMTLAFKDVSDLGDKASFFEKDITPAPFGDEVIMLPFFDMRMNRSAISGPMSPPSFQYDPSWLWCSVEDSQNLYGLGDADALISGDAVSNSQCAAGDVLHVDFDDLFYNTREAYPDMVGPVQLCSRQEILDNIVNWQDDGPTIDFGITDANPNYDRMTRKLGTQLDEYRRNFSTTDDQGFLPEAKPDRIVGWVKCYVGNYKKPVYAPIIPWPTGSDLKAPTRFAIGDYVLDPGTDAIRIPWNISEDLEGQYCKVHDGMGAAGKTMVAMSRETDLGKLRHGRSIDMVTAAESFASRRLAWGKRMCTLKTLALTMATPPYGYNYAEHDAAFPDNPEFKERLKHERIPIEEWPSLYGSIGRLSADPEIDALLRDQVELAIKTGTVNPSDILATKFDGRYTFMYVDYDFMFDTNLGFQNALMKWYNSMQPDVCPPDIDSYYGRTDGKGYLFKPVVQGKNEYERGCLQMAVPHKSAATGKIFYHWENVYMSFSFFNDDYSGLHKVGLNGANRTMEQLNAMAISGKPLEGRNMQLYTENTAAPSFRTYGPNDVELDYGKFLSRER